MLGNGGVMNDVMHVVVMLRVIVDWMGRDEGRIDVVSRGTACS